MKLPEASAGGGFEKAPAGNHAARCYEVIDLGTQERNPYQGQARSPVRQIWIGWELGNETMEDGRPYVIGKKYNFSMNENASLRKDLESWRGKAFTDADLGPNGSFEIQKLIGVGCFLNVVHVEKDDRTYANIEAVAALPKGTKAPEAVNSPTFVCLDPDEFNEEAFANLSERMQGIVAKSPEYQKLSMLNTAATGEPKDTGGADEDTSPF